jgi:uncharacterized damage-inducible protein DinB
MPESTPTIEPWLRGPIEGVAPAVMPLFFSFANVKEDIQKFASGLSPDQLWRKVGANAPVGFHMRHIPGSVDRLLTYLEGGQLTEQQLQYLKHEAEPGATFAQLFTGLEHQLAAAEERLRKLDASDLNAPRYVGRKRLQVTALGLLVHIAEHTQRHLGQAITTAKMVRE